MIADPARARRELARVLTVGAAVWLLHGLVDWLWEMPMLGVFGVALLGLACALAPGRPSRRWGRGTPLGWNAARSAELARPRLRAAITLPWLAARDVKCGGVAGGGPDGRVLAP